MSVVLCAALCDYASCSVRVSVVRLPVVPPGALPSRLVRARVCDVRPHTSVVRFSSRCARVRCGSSVYSNDGWCITFKPSLLPVCPRLRACVK